MRRVLRCVPETGLILSGLIVIPWLPRAWVVRAAHALGDVAYRLCRKLKRIGRANLDIAFGESISTERKESILRESFRTFALVVFDLFWFGVRRRHRIERYVSFDSSMDGFERIRPLLGLTAHLGNWELLGQACAVRGTPLLSVAAPLENPVADFMVRRMRSGQGHAITSSSGAVKALIRELRAGGRVALLLDQNTRPKDGGEFVEFFGLPAPVSGIAALLRARTGADAMMAVCVPDAAGRYGVHALPPLSRRAPDLAPEHTTQAVVGMIEEMVRRYPERWMWMYKRWRFIPDGADPKRYPFYAHRLRAGDRSGATAGVREAGR